MIKLTNSNILFLLVLILVPISLTSCKREEQAAPMPGPMPITVALPIKHQFVEWDHYLGRIEAVETVAIRARVSGHLTAIHFEEGSMVKAGDPIADIDDRPFRAELARAAAESSRAEAGLFVAKAQKIEAEANLNEVTARKRQFESLASLAKKRLERAKKAVAGNAISKETVDIRESEVQQSTSNLEAAIAAIAAAKAGIVTADASIEAAKAAIVAAKADIDRATLDLQYCTLKAPISGRVSQQAINVGNFVVGGGQSGTLITTIVSTAPVYCYFDANEQALLKYLRLDKSGNRVSSRRAKNPVFLALADEEDYPHKGYMDFVDNRMDNQTGTMRARAILRNESGLLVPGMFANLYLPGSAPEMATFIPDTAIVAEQSDRFVWIMEADGQVGRRNVELGPLAMGLRVIRSGLKGDEKVVIRGLQRIMPGAPVAPTLTTIKLVPGPRDLPNDYSPVPKSEWISTPNRGKKTNDGESK